MTRRARQIRRFRDRLLLRQVAGLDLALPKEEIAVAVRRGRIRPGQLIPPRPPQPAASLSPRQAAPGEFIATPMPGSLG